MDRKDLMEKKISSELIFDGKIVKLYRDQVELPDGSTSMREVVRHAGGVGVLPLLSDGTVIVVKQCRYAYNDIITEIPAGKMEYGEDPLECGKRELKEEVGAEAENWIFLGNIYPTVGYDDEIIRIFLATGLTFTGQELDGGEFLDLCRVPLSELVDQVMADELRDAKTALAVLKTQRLIDKGLTY